MNSVELQHSTYKLIAFLLLALFALSLLAFVVYSRRFGFDLTDEAYYYLWMQNPFAYRFSLTQFGFVLHPIYVVFDGSIFAIRLWSDLTSFTLAWILAFLLLRRIYSRSPPLDSAVIAFALAPTAFLATVFELPPSPSYNTCTFQALILYCIGMVVAAGDSDVSKVTRGASIIGPILCGAALFLAALVKPPTLAPLSFLTVLCLTFIVRHKGKFMLISTLVFVFLFAFFLVLKGQTLSSFIDAIRAALRMADLMSQDDAMMSIFRWDPVRLSGRLELYLGASAVIAVGLMLAFNRLGIGFLALVFVCTLPIVVGAILRQSHGELFNERYAGVTVLFFPVSIALFNILRWGPIDREQLILAFLFLALPFAYAFGTNRPYWLNAEGAGLFWVCAGLVLMPRRQSEAILFVPATFLMQVTLAFLLANTFEHPHRQTRSFRLPTEAIDIDGKRHRLFVSPDLARYIETLRALAQKAGFTAGTPVIDLTGRSPGAILVLAGKAPGSPWLLGGYKGSVQFTQAVLAYASCAELAQSWVLVEPQGRDENPPSLLAKWGLDAGRDYEIAGSLPSSATLYGRSFEQVLLKPRPGIQARELACEARRKI